MLLGYSTYTVPPIDEVKEVLGGTNWPPGNRKYHGH